MNPDAFIGLLATTGIVCFLLGYALRKVTHT